MKYIFLSIFIAAVLLTACVRLKKPNSSIIFGNLKEMPKGELLRLRYTESGMMAGYYKSHITFAKIQTFFIRLLCSAKIFGRTNLP